MKFSFAALASAMLLTSTAAFAGIVTSSSNIDFLAIDGQKANKDLLKSTKSFNINESQTHQSSFVFQKLFVMAQIVLYMNQILLLLHFKAQTKT